MCRRVKFDIQLMSKAFDMAGEAAKICRDSEIIGELRQLNSVDPEERDFDAIDRAHEKLLSMIQQHAARLSKRDARHETSEVVAARRQAEIVAVLCQALQGRYGVLDTASFGEYTWCVD